MRLFIALDIDENIRSRIAGFVDGIQGFAPDVRWARHESLHITLKFIGERSDEEVGNIKQVLETVAARVFDMNFRGYGFFPAVRAPRVFWVGVEAGQELSSLAAVVDAKLAALDIPKEEHKYNAHLTLARAVGGSGSPRRQKGDGPNHSFQRLQEKLAELPAPEFGTLTAREFFLYQSQLSPGGSKYIKLARFGLH
jgi:2'-5' RNA ligase